MWNYMGLEIDPEKLIGKQELLAHLKREGEYGWALSQIRDRYEEEFGAGLVWHYPLSDGMCTGGFIVAVQEGYLWVPYDEVDEDNFELLELDKATMMSVESCEFFEKEMRSFSDALCEALSVMRSALSSAQRNPSAVNGRAHETDGDELHDNQGEQCD